MDWKVIAFAALLCNLFFFPQNRVEGFDRLLTREDVKLEEELKHLNKPAVKTIYTKYGVMYDCVDFYKQPAFDDPLLKNHNFHPGMKTGMIPTTLTEEKNVQSPEYIKLGLEDGGCPFGTVPIRRYTKDDLIRAKLYQSMFDSRVTPNDATGHYQAVVRHDTPNHGAGGEYNIYNLPVTAAQFTSGRLKIINNDESLIAGWTVNPGLYSGDTRTHMFVVLNANGRSCFNAQCGFVQVSQEVPVDTVIEPVSTYDGDQYVETFFIAQDPGDSNWYFTIQPNHTVVGFWPKDSVTKLGGGATAVEWGGETYSPPGTQAPGMGAGENGDLNTKRTAFARHCKVVINNNIVDPPLPESDAKSIVDGRYYYAEDVGTTERDGRIIVYGGRGHIAV